ncbi:MAG: tetratricopeptide repeat protein [Oligoflexales bacterium]|nr:tetratricopeptide repeat protein [Oligoflexales bacterium]
MTSGLPSKILVIDNDQGVLNAVAQGLEAYKIQCSLAKDWESALYMYNTHKFDLCLISLELDSLPGTALIQKWRNHEMESKRNAAFVLSTSQQRKSGDSALIKEIGDVAMVFKPIKIPNLLSIMASAMQMAKSRASMLQVKDKLISPLLRTKKYEKAANIAKEKLEPVGDKGKFFSSQIYEAAGKVGAAIDLLKNLIASDPSNMAYHNELAKIYLQTGNLKEAQKCYEMADQAAPGNIERVNDMANLYLKLKMPEKSIGKFSELIKLNPENEDLKYDVYDKLSEAGYLEHAQDFCRQTSTPKELVRHFNNKGVLYSKAGEFPDAIDEYKKAVKLIPGSKELYRILYNMAIAHINLKTFEHLQEAHKLLNESLKMQPDYDKAKEKLKITERYVGRKPS